jgi:filamentous hemagglutinin family protein
MSQNENANKRKRSTRFSSTSIKPTAAALAVASCFAGQLALANPTAPAVVHGGATFSNPAANILNVQTLTPQTIINWGSFSISVGELTRFIQPSAVSAVLNRVVGQDPSQILGALQSNGRVFLINPNGILFGAGAQIDVAGLVASTLNLSNADFLSGRLNFTEVPGAGAVVNQGTIAAAGGPVYLVGPAVTNSGLITSAGGEVVLAAGNRVELVNPGTPNLRVEISAPENEAVNLGAISAQAGRIGIYAGLVRNAGVLSADSAVAEGGRIVLKATRNVTLEAGSLASANGATGGRVALQSGDTTLVAGAIAATGGDGAGGTVHVLGNLVGLIGDASIDVSGRTGGGTALIGGDFQGANAAVQNAYRTFFGPGARVTADAVQSGDGGKIIVWADDVTRFYGRLSARGGAHSGNGGFAEVSGKNYLDYQGLADLRAPNGDAGTLLLDPTNLTISNAADMTCTGFFSAGIFAGESDPTANLSWVTLDTQLGLGHVMITTSGLLTVVDPYTYTSANHLSLVSQQDLFVNGAIANTSTGDIRLFAGWNGVVPSSASDLPTIANSGSVIVNQPLSTQGNVYLQSGNKVWQQAGAPITANGLLASADGGEGRVELMATNMVNVLAGYAYGYSANFQFTNHKPLTTIGSVGAVSGVSVSNSSSDANVGINVSGQLKIDSPVSASGGTYGSASVALTAANGITVNADVGASASGDATVTLNASGGDITTNGVEIHAYSGSSYAAHVTLSAPSGSITLNNSTIEAYGGSYARALISASNGVTINGDGGEGRSVVAETGGGCCGTAVVDILATTAGANIALNNAGIFADGGEGSSLTLNAAGAILQTGTNGVLRAVTAGVDPLIDLIAVSGIGTLANPIRISLNGDPTVYARNTGGTGDIALAFKDTVFTGGSVNIEENLTNVRNNNPTGTYLIKSLDGGFRLGIPFAPDGAQLGPNQHVIIDAMLNIDFVESTAFPGSFGSIRAGHSGGTGNVQLIAGETISIGANSYVTGYEPLLKASDIHIDLGGAVRSSGGFINIREIGGGAIHLGGSPAGLMNLSNDELNRMTSWNGVDNPLDPGSGGGLIIGEDTGGALVFKGAIGPTTAFLNLRGSTITQDPGATVTGGLNVVAPGGVTLTDSGNLINYFTTGGGAGTGAVNLVTAGPILLEGVVTSNAGVTVQASGNITLGSSNTAVNAGTGSVTLTSSGGSVLDNFAGLDIAGASVTLNAAAGAAGSLGNPIEIQTPLLTVNAGNEIGIINSGNLTLQGLMLAGGTGSIGTTGTMDFGSPITPSGNLALLANNGINVNQNVIAGGALLLDAGAGNLSITGGQMVQGATLQLVGGNITLANASCAYGSGGTFASAAGNLQVQSGASLGGGVGYGLTTVTTGGNVVVNNATIVGDPDVIMTVGGSVFVNGTLAMPGAIHAISPTSIHITFPNPGSGFSINGVQDLVFDPATNTGFFVGNPPVPAALGAGLFVTFGSSGSGGLPPQVQQAVFGTLIAESDKTQPSDPQGDKDVFDDTDKDKKKTTMVCR